MCVCVLLLAELFITYVASFVCYGFFFFPYSFRLILFIGSYFFNRSFIRFSRSYLNNLKNGSIKCITCFLRSFFVALLLLYCTALNIKTIKREYTKLETCHSFVYMNFTLIRKQNDVNRCQNTSKLDFISFHFIFSHSQSISSHSFVPQLIQRRFVVSLSLFLLPFISFITLTLIYWQFLMSVVVSCVRVLRPAGLMVCCWFYVRSPTCSSSPKLKRKDNLLLSTHNVGFAWNKAINNYEIDETFSYWSDH